MHEKYFALNCESMANLQACKTGSKITWNHGDLPEWQLAMCKVCKLTGKSISRTMPFFALHL